MPKISPSRLDGVYGMRKFTADQLHEKADRLEAQLVSPTNKDDPRWLKSWIKRIRALADQKATARELKRSKAKPTRRDG
jgi:hypothetical protein